MCISFILEIVDWNYLLVRIMDFVFQLGIEVIFYLCCYNWMSEVDGKVYQIQYVFIGMGRKFGNILFVDGINENGLLCVVFYFLGYVEYEKMIQEVIVYIVLYEFVIWVLLFCKFLEDVKEKM